MVAGLWSENVQDEICQKRKGLVFKRRRDITSMGTFLVVLFLLAAAGATKGRNFLLSEVQLMRIGPL
jgi:hypothetical protein